MAGGFKSISATNSFQRDLKGLDAPQRAAVQDCVEDLLLDIIPAARRFHCVDKKRPKIFTVDVYTNSTTHKLSLNVDEADPTHVILRRVGQHRDIDRNP